MTKLADKQERERQLLLEEQEISQRYLKPQLKNVQKQVTTKEDEFAKKVTKTIQSAATREGRAENGKAVLTDTLKSSTTKLTKSSSSSSFEKIPKNSASNLDDAMFIMDNILKATPDTSPQSTTIAIDRHPERRVKAAYTEFQLQQLPLLKQEFPSLKHSQLMEMMAKLWKKSPMNPFNKDYISYDTSKQEQRFVSEIIISEKLDSLRVKDA